MQAALSIAYPVIPLKPSKSSARLISVPPKSTGSLAARFTPVKATAGAYDTTITDYSSSNSVFPAEACETIGGEACLKVDREYLEYTDTKTVFRGEACDDLGGEFCEPEYLKGV